MTVPDKVIDLAAYRAARGAKRPGAGRTRYLLWYPGVGYFYPAPGVGPVPLRGSPFAHDRR